MHALASDDEWAQTTSAGAGAGGLAQGAYNAAASVAAGAASMASGVAKSAYEFVAGDERARRAGKETSA